MDKAEYQAVRSEALQYGISLGLTEREALSTLPPDGGNKFKTVEELRTWAQQQVAGLTAEEKENVRLFWEQQGVRALIERSESMMLVAGVFYAALTN